MKIVLAIKSMDDAKAGAERVMAAVASALAQRGHQVTLITFDAPGGRSFYPIDSRVRRVCLGIGHSDRRTTVLDFLRRIPAIRQTVRDVRPDIAIGFMHSMYIPIAVALLGTGVPILASEHLVPDYYRHRKLEYFLFLLSSFSIDRFSVLSNGVRQRFPSFLHAKMVVLPNPVYPATIHAAPNGKGVAVKTVLNVGRLVDIKDQRTLIAAFAQLAASFPDWRLHIIGEGELRGELEAQVADLGLQERVQLPGTTSTIEKEYAASHIFAISSRYEGFGLVTAEASSHGLPTVGFADCPGTNELIEDGVTGILVDSTDRVRGLAEALRCLMSDAELRKRMGSAGIDKMRAYAPERIFDKWEETIGSMVAVRA